MKFLEVILSIIIYKTYNRLGRRINQLNIILNNEKII